MTGEAFTACLRAGTEGQSAASVYTSTFKDSNPARAERYPKARPGPAGAVMAADFGLIGQKFAALTAGPQFTFHEAISFQIPRADQAEADYCRARPSEGGPEVACGWRRTSTACHGKSSLACSST
jgi:predicted 3-demethylubiquinone-9 3-methyltransferase (glyoxalase superfamily)